MLFPPSGTCEKTNINIMKTKQLSPVGSLHPVLFFAVVYIVALLFAVFICSSLFYSCNATAASRADKQDSPSRTMAIKNEVALR